MASYGSAKYRCMVPRIHCAVCNREVDHTEVLQDCESMAHIIRVKCHGVWDTCKISDFDIMEYGMQQFLTGRAFESHDQQIEGKPKTTALPKPQKMLTHDKSC